MKQKTFSVNFTINSHDSGMSGIVPTRFQGIGWDSYIPSYALSHEILEHGAGEKGLVFQEIQALGAILFVRGWKMNEGAYTGQCRGLFYSSELTSIYRDATSDYSERDLFELPKFPRFSLTKEENAKFERLFENILSNLGEYWESEINYDGESDEENYFLANWENVKLAFKHGYYKAKRRWENFNVFALRQAIDAECKAKEKELEMYEDTSQVFTLKCEVSEYYATARIVSNDRYSELYYG